MRSFRIVEGQVLFDSCPNFLNNFVLVQIDVFVFQRTPEPFYERVVQCPASPIHADSAPLPQDHADPGFSCELGALIGIDDLWNAR